MHYYVRGGALVNCVCGSRRRGWEIEPDRAGALSELRADFAGWHADLQTLIGAIDTDALFKWAPADRAPMARWGVDRITLLGDAPPPHAACPWRGVMRISDRGRAVLGWMLWPGGAGLDVRWS